MTYQFGSVRQQERVREMAGEGEEKKGKSDRKRDNASKKEGKAGRKARKARGSRGGKKPNGQQRADLISAIAHPLRRCILRVLHDWREPGGPAQIARELGLPVGTVVYHVRVLWRYGAVGTAGEQQVRGAIEHFYDSTIEDDPPIETLLEETREVDEEGK
jgi:Helix-turn-helix domain